MPALTLSAQPLRAQSPETSRDHQQTPASTSDPQTLIQSLTQQAKVLEDAGDYAAASKLWEVILALTIQVYGEDHLDTALSLDRLAIIYSEQDRYSDAEVLFRRSLAIQERILGPQHPDTPKRLNNLALLYTKQGRNEDAAVLYQRSLAIREKVLGSAHLDTASSLSSLAILYSEEGRLGEAEPLFQRSLAIREKLLGEDHPETALSLNNLALLYAEQGHYSDAEPLYKRSVAIHEKLLGKNHPTTAAALNNLASLYSDQGRHSDAERLYQRSFKIRVNTLGEDHLDTAASLNNLGLLYEEQGRFRDAEIALQRSLEIHKKRLGLNHPRIAASLNNLANLHSIQGLYSSAERLLQQSLAIREKKLGADHPETASSLYNLASLYSDQGRYSAAEQLHQRSLAIRENALGQDHPETASGLSGLANVYYYQGRYSDAEPLYYRSLVIQERILGADHVRNVAILNNLAGLYSKQRRYRDAEISFKRALSIQEKASGPDHPRTALILSNLGLFYTELGEYGNAEPLHQRSLAINEKSLGKDHPSTAAGIGNLAHMRARQGYLEEAESLYKRSLAINEMALPPGHPDIALSLMNLSGVYFEKNELAKAGDLLSKIGQWQGLWLRRELPLLPRGQRLVQLNALPDAARGVFMVLEKDSSNAPLALRTRLNRQGLLAEIEQRQQLILSSSPDTQQLAERLAGLDRQLASITLTPGQRKQLSADRQQLEGDLYRKLPELRIEPVTTDQVAQALRQLAPQGLLVEFQRYRPWQRSTTGGGEWGAARYIALTLRPDGRINAIKLGEAAPIEAAIARAVEASAANQADAPQLWSQVSALLFTPLQQELNGVQELFISPDGELNRIAFAALPAPGQAGQLLNQALQLRLLTTGRDLLRLQQPATAGATTSVVMANPQFEAQVRRSNPNSRSLSTSASNRQQRSATQQARQRRWDPLPATEQEAQIVAPLLKAGAPITGSAATTARALAQRSPRILHIATHGFFDPEQPAEAKPQPAGGQLLGVANPSPLPEDPLLRSGIVLAGANHPDADPNDDGYLTAAEVTGMDLRHTELVTLSACETGLGSVRSGEGVYGLQRALTVAGSRSTLLSLWKVDDGATAAFMAEFYRRLMAGEGRADALRSTQAAFRTHANPLYRDVYVWGAFQLTGDWRPIQTR